MAGQSGCDRCVQAHATPPLSMAFVRCALAREAVLLCLVNLRLPQQPAHLRQCAQIAFLDDFLLVDFPLIRQKDSRPADLARVPWHPAGQRTNEGLVARRENLSAFAP